MKYILIAIILYILLGCTKTIDPALYDSSDIYNCMVNKQCDKFITQGLTYDENKDLLLNNDYISEQLKRIFMSSPIITKHYTKINPNIIFNIKNILESLNIEVLHFDSTKGYIYAKTKTKIYKKFYMWKWKSTNMILIKVDNDINNSLLEIYISILTMEKKPLEKLFNDTDLNDDNKKLKKILITRLNNSLKG